MKNANFMASLKAFFSKAWTATKAFSIKAGKWIVANKLISIPVAVVLVGGIACAIALPIALHEHDFATEWSTDANNHWHSAICSHEEEKSDLGAHAYDNACDTTCNVCGATRTVGAHAYDNDCDTTCNTCGATRIVGAHVYDNACDTTCNACGETRAITHDHADTLTAGDTTHYYLCSVCGDKKDEVAHVFDKTVASSEYLKAEATATTKAQYYKSCVCGKASDTEYFETDKAPANLQVADISKTYDGTPVAEPTVTFDGVGAENFAYYKGNEKLTERPTDAGTYKVVVTVDETDTHAGDRVEREFTIAKKVLSGLTVDLPYAGTNSFEVPLGAANGILAGDVADGIKVCITFANKNVGAAVTGAGLDADDGDNYLNYELDLTTCTANIVPKVLSNVKTSVIYDGSTTFGEITLAHDGIVAGDIIIADIDVANKNVGVYTGTGAVFAILDVLGNGAANYEINEQTTEVTVTPKTLNYLELTKVYDGEGLIAYALGAEHGVVEGDTVVFTCMEEIDYYAGTYYLIDENDTTSIVDAGVDRAILGGVDGGNYQFANQSESGYDGYDMVAKITVTPKTLNYLEITKVYNGKEGFNDSFDRGYALGTEQGVIAGDEVILGTNDDIDYDVGTYVLSDSNGSWDLDDSCYIVGDDKGNYQFNYKDNGAVATITVTPKTINVTAEFEYSGINVRQIHAPALSLSDVIDGDEVYIEIAFDKADVGATVLTGEDAPYLDGADCDNYTLGTYSFSIVPAKLTLKAGETIEVTETYNGQKQHTLTVSSNMFDGYVDTEVAQLWLTATLPSKNAGEYTNGVILTPYVGNSALGTVSHNYDFSEVEATVTIKPLTVSLSSYVMVEYNGTSEFTLDTPFDLTSANTGGGQDSVSDNDEVYITWIETSDAGITDETFAIDYTLGGADAGNYDIDELGVEITKKKLTNLHLYITSDTYESGEITLLEKDGVVAGDVVKISITDINDQDFGAGFYIFMELEDGTSPDAYRYETIALVPSGDYANYELATYDDGSGYQVVGIVEGVESCDVQYDGSCNCGTSHLIGTVASSDIRTPLPCATTWTGGVYKISTLAGYWSILPSDNFADITAIYDANGNEVEIDANDAGFYAEAGTYYVHIGKASDLGTAQQITFTHTHTLANLEGAAAKSDLITAKSGDAIFFRIENDAPWGASMNVFSDNETTILDSSKYTVKVYDEYFNELTGVIYDGTDVTHSTDENYSVVDKTIYIEVLLSADTNVQIYIY